MAMAEVVALVKLVQMVEKEHSLGQVVVVVIMLRVAMVYTLLVVMAVVVVHFIVPEAY